MSDFVRKSDVLDLLYGIFDKYKMSTDKNTSIGKSFGTDVFEEIRNMPTAYSVDKVVEELEELKAYAVYEDINADTKWLDKAIEIVKQCGVDVVNNATTKNDDVCEWRIVDRPNNLPIYNTSCGKIRLQCVTGVDIYCNGCGKKIKVVE